jgi:hypothetical protein
LEASLMHGHGSAHRAPRWVKVIGIMGIALLLLFAGLHVAGTNLLGHGLGGHGSHAPLSGAAKPGMQKP